MAAQPGMAQHRLHTSWHAAQQSYCSPSFALQRHLLGYGTGIESREKLGQVVHVNAQLKPARLLAWSSDVGAAGHGPAPTPDQLVHSASLVLAI